MVESEMTDTVPASPAAAGAGEQPIPRDEIIARRNRYLMLNYPRYGIAVTDALTSHPRRISGVRRAANAPSTSAQVLPPQARASPRLEI